MIPPRSGHRDSDGSPLGPGDQFRDPYSRFELRRDRLSDISDVVRSLQADAATAPDLTDSILSRVNQQKPFLDPATRQFVVAGRAAMALAVLVVATSIALIFRFAPEYTSLAAAPKPLSDLVEVTQDATATQFETIRARIQTVAEVGPAVQRCLTCPEAPAEVAVASAPPGIRVVPVNRLGDSMSVSSAIAVRPTSTRPVTYMSGRASYPVLYLADDRDDDHDASAVIGYGSPAAVPR
ncbi:MAG: hypothetical protein KF745_13485 [Phycisphaeraceae bacterium]|nr:hypothetical protein [Phycisphaeraceae bacterium]